MAEHETVTKADVDGKITTHKADASAHHTKTSKASEITSEQFPLNRMPRAASGVLTAKGVGVNPAYEAPAGARPIGACDTLAYSNDTEKTTSATTYTKLKEIKFHYAPGSGSSMRIKFDFHTTGSVNCKARIYRNGVAIGTEQSMSTNDYITVSEDLDASSWVVDDLIQIYAYRSTAGPMYVQNMRLYYTFKTTTQDP